MNKVKRLKAFMKGRIATSISTLLLLTAPCIQAQERPAQWDLTTCINYAMEQNIQIRKSKIALEESLIDTKTAQAALFPSLSFSTSQNLVNKPLNNVAGISKNSYSGNYGLNSSWTLYNGGKREKTIEQQKLQNRIQELSINKSRNDIKISITECYLQILYAYESVKINKSTVEVSRAQRDRADELLKAGSIAQSDYAQLESQYSTDKYQLVTAEATLKDYKLQLKQLLELDGADEMDLVLPELQDTTVLTPLPDKLDVYREALALMPEIQSSKLAMDVSKINIAIAKAGYMPTLSASAGIGTSHSSGTDYTFGEQIKNGWSNSLGLTLSVPIFNNRETKSAVQKAKLASQDSGLDNLNEQKTLFKTIENIYLDALSSQNRFVAATENLKSTQTSYDLIQEQFNLGMKNTVELLTEKNNLLSAHQEVLQAKYMAILNSLLLNFYRGTEISLNN